MRTLALRRLLPLASPVDKIVLGRQYGFGDWLTPAFVAVCARAEPLSLAEAKRMDGEDVARIYQAREKARGSSISVPSEVAQEAVACVFYIGEETTATPYLGKDDVGHSTVATIDNLDLRTESSNTDGVSLEHVTTDVSAGDAEVDDGLMEALVTWSRISSRFKNLQFDHVPTGSYVKWGAYLYTQYTEYEADYKSLLTYVGGSQVQVASLRRLISVVFQSDLNRTRSAFCTQLFMDLHKRMNNDLPKSTGIKINLVCIANELCLELVRYECTLQDASNPFGCWYRPASLVANLLNAGVLTEEALRACFPYLILLPSHADTGFLQHMCAFLTSHGKTFDHKSCRDLMDNIFVQLRKYALEWRCQPAHDNIVVSSHYK
jgi:hypothetical protein